MSDKADEKNNPFKIDYERLAGEIAKRLPPVNIHVHVSPEPGTEDWDKAIDEGLGDALERAYARGVRPGS